MSAHISGFVTSEEAVQTARELARRLGSHLKPSDRHAVALTASKAGRSSEDPAETVLIAMPTWENWPGPGPAFQAERVARRLLKGPGHADPANSVRICEGRDSIEHGHNAGETENPAKPPAVSGTEKANAVIFGDSHEILTKAVELVKAVRTGPWPENSRNGLPVHIPDAVWYGNHPDGTYWSCKLSEMGADVNRENGEAAPKYEEVGEALARMAEETAEIVARGSMDRRGRDEVVRRLNEMAVLADRATDEGARSLIVDKEHNGGWNADWNDDLPF